jgi:CDP-2,3-bis-(O-geranylgeranyl)-sn-glycerol synthase
MSLILLVAETFYLYLPAYVANAAPVLLGGGRPLDGGRLWIDGRPLLGSHKTVRGVVSALILGTLTGIAQASFSLSPAPASPLIGFLQSLGAVLGDLSTSFLKRRLGLKPGALLPFLDQLSFIITAIILSYPLQRPTTSQFLIVLALTLLIHPLTNFIAYLIGLKKEPW